MRYRSDDHFGWNCRLGSESEWENYEDTGDNSGNLDAMENNNDSSKTSEDGELQGRLAIDEAGFGGEEEEKVYSEASFNDTSPPDWKKKIFAATRTYNERLSAAGVDVREDYYGWNRPWMEL
jgi:hypothetical protein